MDEPTDSWRESLSAEARVRAVALTVGEPRTANWIAEEASVAHGTARKYLTQLVEDRQLVADRAGDRTTYRPDPVGQYLREVRDLYEEHSAGELAERLAEMTEQLRSWREEYGVETPNELRASLAEADEPGERRRVADEWAHLEHRRSLVEDALRLYDRFPGDTTPTPA